jgi:hypothetical protein
VKNLRLVWASLAIVAAATWAVYAIACDKSKSTTATNASAASASKGSCPYGAAKMTTASTSGAKDARFVTASAGEGCGAHGAKSANVTTASAEDHCAGAKSTSAATFATAGTSANSKAAAGGDACCMAKGAKSAKNTTAGYEGCQKGGAAGAAMTGVMACNGHMSAAMCEDAHGACDACADMARSDAALMDGTEMQAVPIKNGVMFIYSASKPGQVNAIQSAMARRSEHLSRLVSAGDKARLCPECRTMRGAMASGKVTREVVNIEGGSLTLLTSNDPAMVKKIRSIADHARTGTRKS